MINNLNMVSSFLFPYVKSFKILFVFSIFLFGSATVSAATLSLSPGSGVYNTGATFTARVVVNSGGQSINAAEGTLKFNPNELSVVSANRTGSIFNLWITEPAFSNSAGTVSFSGGLPSGYTGSSGTVMNVTFRAKGSGPAKVTFSNGSVLANDGRGTNVLSGMNGGTYTIQAASTEPVAEEVIIEYVAPANTPGAPQITSVSHPDPTAWYKESGASLKWSLPAGVTGVRTLLDRSATAIPTKVYDDPISSIDLSLDEGVQYFHLQFRNADGWGRVTHYRLAVDTKAPSEIVIISPENSDFTNPIQELQVKVEDEGGGVERFMIRVDASDPFEYIREEASSTIPLPELEPGYHTVVIEALDKAGNSVIGTYSFTITAFEKPEFTEYPTQINEEVIPVIKGLTRPNSQVEVSVRKIGSEPTVYSVTSNEQGEFTFIPEGRFSSGVYELTATAIDEFGAHSEASEAIRLAVQQPGYLRIGSFIVSFLSVLVPLIALLVLSGFAVWYLLFYVRKFRSKVRVESFEALQIVKKEFTTLRDDLEEQKVAIGGTRKTKKLTKAEASMFDFMADALDQAETRVEKEVEDVAKLTRTISE